ncbi:MAG: 3-dehydroquinate synthase [Pirellulaceae bacterium]
MDTDIVRVPVDLSDRGYEIYIGSGLLRQTAQHVQSSIAVTQVVAITDSNLKTTHAQIVTENLAQAGIVCDLVTIPAGEGSKSLGIVEQIWNEMLAAKADRQTVVIAVGGGVVGDLAGFVAATYARGIPLIQIPTTLLAQVDSSVGGKVGINLAGAKNMAGAFWQPTRVLIDPLVLHTLPDREYQAGLAEVIKYGVIMDAEFFALLEDHVEEIHARDVGLLKTIISRCCQLKAQVVEQDERETTGLRAILNYGHTFCHAFETVTNYGRFLHGEAVAIGMMCAARLAESMGRIDQQLISRQAALLTACNLPLTVSDIDPESLLAAMQHDKKVEHGKLRFVLPTKIGHVELVDDVSMDLVRAALTT